MRAWYGPTPARAGAPMSVRPRALHHAACRAGEGKQTFDVALREFLDSFYADPEQRQAAIRQQPPPLDPLRDAYIGAVAEHLARCYRLAIPDSAETQGMDLKHPFFAGKLGSLKARLTVESPTAFRRRMLFVSKDALSRPHAPADAQ
jgi:hypothetical protein